jgi:hypothetical protein
MKVYRYQEQFGRVPDDKGPLAIEVRKLLFRQQLPLVLRLALLALTAYLSYRLDWGLRIDLRHYFVALIWAVAIFTLRGGFSRTPTRPRIQAVRHGLLTLIVAHVTPLPLALFMTTTIIIGGVARGIGMAIFYDPRLHTRKAIEGLSALKYLRSVPPDRPME